MKSHGFSKTSIWLMCGEKDGYLSQIRKAYENIKNNTLNSKAIESQVTSYDITYKISHATSSIYNAMTSTLTKNGIIIARETEFAGEGHIIITTPFGIPSVDNHSAIKWTFDQSLTKR